MHRLVSPVSGIGLTAQSARRQSKKQMRVWAKHMGCGRWRPEARSYAREGLICAVIPGRCEASNPESRDSPQLRT
jgi:hypothetical protein